MKEGEGPVGSPEAADEFFHLPEEARLPAGSAAVELFDPLKKYLAEIRRFPLLSREEELELAKRWWHEKDRQAALDWLVEQP